jgi:hypothetical protein
LIIFNPIFSSIFSVLLDYPLGKIKELIDFPKVHSTLQIHLE